MRELLHKTLFGYARHFPLQKGKHRVVSRLWKPVTSGRTHRECRLSQADVRMKCDLTKYIQREIYFFGAYEPENCAYWMKLAKDAHMIFDVGSNVGLYSLLASAANPTAEIHGFEPTPEVFDALVENIALNAPSHINPNKIALGRLNGTGVLNRCGGAEGDNEGMNFVSVATEESDATMQLLTLDEYCAQKGISQIDLMKVDVEGGEYDVFAGASRLLESKAIKCLFFELLDWAAERSGHTTEQVKNQLWERGYHLYKFEGAHLHAFGPGEPHADNVVALAEPRP